MIAAFISVLVLAATAPSAQPSAQPSPPPAVRPLREVVYNVTVANTTTNVETTYGGTSSQQGLNSTDRGTVTVDIMAVANNALGIEVTELMNKKGSPYTFRGAVTPDGTVVFEAASIEDVTRELLQYFGTQFIPPDKLALGATWQVDFDRGGSKVQTTFTVTKIDGGLLTLHEQQQGRFSTYNSTATTDGTIVLKPSVLAPVSGEIHKVLRTTDTSGEQKQTLTLHFERVSDSRDLPAH